MLSSVLNSERAVEINIQIMRAFVRLREMIASHKDLARKLDALERKLESHDVHIRSLFEASFADRVRKDFQHYADKIVEYQENQA